MRKLFAALSALLILFGTFVPADAAITTSRSSTQQGDATLITAAITATSNDTTDPINSLSIDNRDGRILSISAMLNETASSGTSPTANVIIQGSNDGTNFFTIQSGDATPVAVQSGAVSTSSAAVIGVDSRQELRGDGGFPAFLRVQVDQGGTTPGLTGVLSVFIVRQHVQK